MPSGDKGISPNDPDLIRTEESAKQFEIELERMLDGFGNYPSIVIWVAFNEGWGQYDTERITKKIKNHDPSRLVICASGWSDRKVGDIYDIHSYPGPAMPELEDDRAVVLGEFGGLGLPIVDHLWDITGWGYRNYKNTDELTGAYRNLMRDLKPMIRKGLAAAVYTQTTDVETEVNGLLTYDRAVIKMDLDEFNRIYQGYFSPRMDSQTDIFTESGIINIYNEGQPGDIRYTTDGSEPGKNSKIYKKPVKFTKTTTVKARIFWPDGTNSDVTEYTCKKVTLKKASQVDGLKPGLMYDYYEGENVNWSVVPDLSKMTPKFSAIASQCDNSYKQRDEWYALKFEGYVTLPNDGIYTFYTSSDDGSYLYIDSEEVVNNDGSHPMVERSGLLALKAGTYPIKVTFHQGMGGQGLEVSYKGPGIEKQVIPAKVLSHKE